MILHCPYCEIKEVGNSKTIYEPIEPEDGRCSDCGAYLDVGQHSVKVNGYIDTYKGALRLMNSLVEQFMDILEYCEVDLEAYFDDEPCVFLRNSQIVRELFIPYYGGTTNANFRKALGINEEEYEIGLRRDDV